MAFSETDSGEIAGVGGWLAFLVISLGILSPPGILISTLIGLYGDELLRVGAGDAWPTIEAVEWSLTAVAIAGAMYLAWRLWTVHVWTTVRIVIPGLWLLSLGSLVAEVASFSLILNIPIRDIVGELEATAFRPLVYSTIWTLYLLNSRRVANTYQRNPVPEGIAEVFE